MSCVVLQCSGSGFRVLCTETLQTDCFQEIPVQDQILIQQLRHSEFLQLFHEIKSIPSSVTHSWIIPMSYRDCIPLHSHCNTCVQKYWLSPTTPGPHLKIICFALSQQIDKK